MLSSPTATANTNKRPPAFERGKRLLGLTPLLFFLLASEVTLPSQAPPNAGGGAVTSGNILIFGSIYGLSVLIFVATWRKSLAYLQKTGVALALLLGLMMFSFLWTVAPLSVAKEMIHFGGVLLIGALAGSALQKNPESFFVTLFTFAIAIVLVSIPAVWYLPNTAIGLNGRWQGITAHPNHFGIVSMLGVYSALAVALMKPSRWRWKVLGLLSTPLFLYCLVRADSITSLMIALFYVAAIPSAVFFMRSQRVVVALLKAILWTSIVLTLILTAYVVDPDLFQIDAFLNRVGRSRTLTGRLDLWTLGWQAFLERPLVGWGFDNLLTLSAQSLNRISYGQFHNGYLDVLVRGGILGSLLALAFIGMLTLRILNALRRHRELAVLLLILLAGILAHNLTETSLMQFPNALWMLTVSLHYVVFALQGRQPQASTSVDRPAMPPMGTYAYSRNYRATPWRA